MRVSSSCTTTLCQVGGQLNLPIDMREAVAAAAAAAAAERPRVQSVLLPEPLIPNHRPRCRS
jgi:hypothetical protein